MKINGIGIIRKETAMSILTAEGRKAVKNGSITIKELGEMYKLEMVKKASKIGAYEDTFDSNYNRIPASLIDKLTPTETAALVDSYYKCYSEGKAEK